MTGNNAHQHTGKLTEITTWGTGFIEEMSGKVFGFHVSMLDPQSGWANTSVELAHRAVKFDVVDGAVANVVICKDASSAKAAG